MTTENKNRDNPGPARLAADTVMTVTVGGTVLAAEKAAEKAGDAVDQIVDGAERAVRSVRGTVQRSANAASDAVDAIADSATSSADGRGQPYEERTRDELYALAAERDITGRSTMRKAELIAALRAER
jgi:hypothetical protein